MKAKKLLSLLLALIMCAGLVPAQVLAAGNKTIVINTDGVENGTVEIVSIPDDATQDGNKITGLTAKTGFVTVKATPKEGYEFINWTARFTMNNGSTWVPKPHLMYITFLKAETRLVPIRWRSHRAQLVALRPILS